MSLINLLKLTGEYMLSGSLSEYISLISARALVSSLNSLSSAACCSSKSVLNSYMLLHQEYVLSHLVPIWKTDMLIGTDHHSNI